MTNNLYINEENAPYGRKNSPIELFIRSVLWSFTFTIPFWITTLYVVILFPEYRTQEIMKILYFILASLLVLIPAIYVKESEKKKTNDYT